jgi:hypothetical protein
MGILPTPDLQAEALSFTLICLKHYLFFEACLMINEKGINHKMNTSKIINKKPYLSSIYNSLQQLSGLYWATFRSY